MALEFIFFDIGGTLGERDAAGRLVPFPGTIRLLTSFRDIIKVRMGIITTLGDLSNDDGRELLRQAGLLDFFEPHAFVSEHDVNGEGKPSPAIYKFAAQAASVRIERCLFIGENLAEVAGAMVAGMQGILKPFPPGRDSP
jgi:FMN phosphatase YigB (HAD superfamily)